MGTFEFKWTHPASEVYVTGTFDDWSKSEKLTKTGDVFAKDVTLSDASTADKIYYKFVVDGNWVTDHTAPQENDASGNLNNVLTTDRIKKHTPATAGILSGVTPSSTTAGLAKDVPVEKHQRTGSSDLPGAFPETPAAVEDKDFSVTPLPAMPGAVNPITLAPGEKVPDASTLTSNTINSGIRDDPELVAADQKREDGIFSVSPLPAFPGAVNPVQVEAGKGLPDPSTFADNQSPSVTIQSAGPQSTTAQLAAGVPLESTQVPAVVKDSQKEAGVSPEASGVPEEVREKAAVENELLKEVPRAPVTSDGSTASWSGAGIAAAGGAAVAAAAGAIAATGVQDQLPVSVQKSINEMKTKSTPPASAKNTPSNVQGSTAESPEAEANAAATVVHQKTVKSQSLSAAVPDPATSTPALAGATPAIVQESIAQSGQSPEAASNESAVLEKKAVEQELLSNVTIDDSTGTAAPAGSGGGLDIPSANDSRDVSPHDTSRALTTQEVPAAAQSAQQRAPVVTTGLDSATTAATSKAEPEGAAAAPAAAAAAAAAEPASAPSTPAKDSAAGTHAASTSGNHSSPASATTTEKKKKNRVSLLFSKIKDKF